MPIVLINFRVDETLRAAAQEAARRESRSLSGMIEAMLIDKCKAAGTLARDWVPPKP